MPFPPRNSRLQKPPPFLPPPSWAPSRPPPPRSSPPAKPLGSRVSPRTSPRASPGPRTQRAPGTGLRPLPRRLGVGWGSFGCSPSLPCGGGWEEAGASSCWWRGWWWGARSQGERRGEKASEGTGETARDRERERGAAIKSRASCHFAFFLLSFSPRLSYPLLS